MRVVGIVGFAGIGFSVAPGEVVDLPDAVAADAVTAGYARAAEAKAETTAKTAKKAGAKK